MQAHPDDCRDSLRRLLFERHSCRAFLPDPVDRGTIIRILEIAQRAPSWCNAQPWQVIVTSGEGTERFREGFHRHAGKHEPQPDLPFPREYHGRYRERRRECGLRLYQSVGIARGDREAAERQRLENYRLFGAPHVAIITTDEALGVYGAVDCGAYVTAFILAAQSCGIASIPQAAIGAGARFVRGHFGLPDERLVVCGISFGYEDKTHPANGFRTTRAALEEAVAWVDA